MKNYNNYSYYRNNPYYHQGYMPPIAHKNRKQPAFIGQIPMGNQYLQPIGRRQFTSLHHKSNIRQENILSSPQKYPYQNRIAMDKSYLRNLNTIDIQGAKSGTVVSQAVRNRMKAQIQLQKQKKQRKNQSQIKLQNFLRLEQQQRRQLAQRQYQKNKQLQQLIASSNNSLKKLSRPNNTIDTDSLANQRNRANKSMLLDDRRNQYMMDNLNNNQVKMINYHNKIQNLQNQPKNPQREGQYNNYNEQLNNKDRKSIDKIYEQQRYQFVNPLKQLQKQHRYSQKPDQNSKRLGRQNSNGQSQTQDYQSNKQQKISNNGNYFQMKNSKDLRKINPSHLSSINQSFSLAGKNSLDNY